MADEKVSVIIPAYNAERWLKDCVDSILAQDHSDLEVIIVNDGSKDGTLMLARSFTDPRVRVADRTNGGVSAARNMGLDLATGNYITFLDADDAMLPDNLSKKLRWSIERDVPWVFGDLVMCDEQLRPTGEVQHATNGDVVNTILDGRAVAIPAPCSNLLARRSCFDRTRFDPELSNAADQHIALRLASRYAYARLPEALTLYRVLPGSMSRNIALYERDHLMLFRKAEALGLMMDPGRRRSQLAAAYWSIAGSWWVNGREPMKALPWLLKSVMKDPGFVLGKLLHRKG